MISKLPGEFSSANILDFLLGCFINLHNVNARVLSLYKVALQ